MSRYELQDWFHFTRIKWRMRSRHTWFMIRSHITLAILIVVAYALDLGIRPRPRPALPVRKDLLWAGIALWPLLWWLFHFPHAR